MKWISLLIILALSVMGTTTLAAENCEYPSYQHTCPGDNPWAECHKYELVAQIDENFCKMLVFIQGYSAPYIRQVPGTICYPDTLGGKVCMQFSDDIARVWTIGDTHFVQSVYVQYIHQGAAILPLVMRRQK